MALDEREAREVATVVGVLTDAFHRVNGIETHSKTGEALLLCKHVIDSAVISLRALLPREESLEDVCEELVAWWNNETRPLPAHIDVRLRAALARRRGERP